MLTGSGAAYSQDRFPKPKGPRMPGIEIQGKFISPGNILETGRAFNIYDPVHERDRLVDMADMYASQKWAEAKIGGWAWVFSKKKSESAMREWRELPEELRWSLIRPILNGWGYQE